MKFTNRVLRVSSLAAGLAAVMMAAPLFAATVATKSNAPVYNPATMVDVVGIITAVHQAPAGSPMEGVHLTVKSKTNTFDVYLGPADFLKMLRTNFPVGDQVEVVGSKVSADNRDVI